MTNTNRKLLSINNLKKYFPVGKSGLFDREQLYVKANDGISLDIYEGETVGLVGESGCGKSTLGKVLLQLYEQTAGSTMYYGKSLRDVAPVYVQHTLKHAKRYIEKYRKLQEKADKLSNECDKLGENAQFTQIDARNIAVSEAQNALHNVATVLGGFMALESVDEGASLLLKIHRNDIDTAMLEDSIFADEANYDLLLTRIENAKKDGSSPKAAARLQIKADATKSAIDKKRAEKQRLDAEAEALRAELATLKMRYLDSEEFQKYDAMLDDGIDLVRLKTREMRRLRKDLQIIFQDPYSSLNPRMTVGQIIEEGLVTHNFFRHGSVKMKEYILKTMTECGLQDYMLYRYPHQFSGGQRQRICIARALAVQPRFVVCDECVSALDVSIQSQIVNLLLELKEKDHLTYLFISHDLSVVRYISDRICVMYLGNVVELADTDAIFGDPRHPYTIALLSSVPTTDPDDLSGERILLEGNIPSPIKPPSGCKFHTRCYMACDKCKRVPPELKEVAPGHFVACHFPERKLDENGNYLFEVPKTERKSTKIAEVNEADVVVEKDKKDRQKRRS